MSDINNNYIYSTLYFSKNFNVLFDQWTNKNHHNFEKLYKFTASLFDRLKTMSAKKSQRQVMIKWAFCFHLFQGWFSALANILLFQRTWVQDTRNQKPTFLGHLYICRHSATVPQHLGWEFKDIKLIESFYLELTMTWSLSRQADTTIFQTSYYVNMMIYSSQRPLLTDSTSYPASTLLWTLSVALLARVRHCLTLNLWFELSLWPVLLWMPEVEKSTLFVATRSPTLCTSQTDTSYNSCHLHSHSPIDAPASPPSSLPPFLPTFFSFNKYWGHISSAYAQDTWHKAVKSKPTLVSDPDT